MWFRTGSFPDDRFSVSTLKKRMRRKNKSTDDGQKQADSGEVPATGSTKAATLDRREKSKDRKGSADRAGSPSGPVTVGLMVIRPPPRTYKKSSSKSRLDGSKKAITMPITDTRTTTGSATIKSSKSNTNLNINTLIKNKLNHNKHSPARFLAKLVDHHDGGGDGGTAPAGPYPLSPSKSISSSRAHLLHLSSGNLAPGHHKKYKLQKSKSRKALQQQQSKRSSIPSSTAAESFTKKPEANTPHEDEDDRGTINSRKRVPSSAGEDEEEVDDSGDSTGNARQPSDRRQDLSGQLANTSGASDHLNNSSSDAYGYKQPADDDQFRENVKSKSAPVSVNRSESYKERSQKKTRTTRRKTSDPSLTKTADEQNEASSLANNNYSSSSTSSLPLALDSRSASMEAVGGGATTAVSSAGPAGTVSGINPTHSSPGGVGLPSSASTTSGGTGGGLHGGPVGSGGSGGPGGLNVPTAREWIDSDDEGTVEPEADWSSNIAPEILSSIGDLEKKRQEVINEIYQTERNHVRTLRLLEGIFMRPLQESGALPHDLLNLLFPHSLIHLKDLHTAFELKLKQRRSEHGNIVREIGDLLLTMFDGQTGEELKEHAAHFCARQQIALEALKERRKKDEQLQRILTKAESHKACRRLQLKDLLPTALQRLTKYPLLFDNLYNFTVRSTPKNEGEALAIRKSHESAKRILDHVNQAVRTEEDMHKLATIQRKLDKSGLDKEAAVEFKNIDLTVRKLIHDGPLTMKKNPGVQLHGLLFEDIMVLLQKQDDKYLVKYHSSPGLGGSESKYAEGRFNPITKIHLILVRQSAVDKNTFFLINTNVSQMLELTAPSSTECKT
uniref:DH domain-containing protein n=1 Tax=Anopheles coluzzii TaxID=1518534 RepID=A0A8W7P8R0_ANOCL